jgi:2-phosphosulfolactate phosphatase
MTFAQAEFQIRCEWGEQGIRQLAPISEAVVIVDVLSFSTCVDIATSQGATVFPYRWKDESALDYARSVQAELASLERRTDCPSLAPSSLLTLLPQSRLVLASPNGASLSLLTGNTITITGCLRNCEAVARFLRTYKTIAVIPAGERWPDQSLRPAIEDWIGAGAILSYLQGQLSPEAEAAIAAFENYQRSSRRLHQCSSGKELIAKGFAADVELAAQLNVSDGVPLLTNAAYKNHR